MHRCSIVLLYLALIWLVFFKLKWLPFNWMFGTLAGLIGVGIVLVFVGLLSYMDAPGSGAGKLREREPWR